MQALVISWIYYFSALYMGLPLGLIWRLQWVQNAVARRVVGAAKFNCITLVLACLHWLLIASCVRFKVLTFKEFRSMFLLSVSP